MHGTIDAPCGREIAQTTPGTRVSGAAILTLLNDHEGACPDCQSGTVRPRISLVKPAPVSDRPILIDRPFCPECGQSGHGSHGTRTPTPCPNV